MVACADRLTRIMSRLVVDERAMERNLAMSGRMTLAEPLYIILAGLGHPDAHEAVRRLTLQSEQTGEPPVALMEHSDELRPYAQRMTPDQRRVLSDYRQYTGIAASKARKICDEWRCKLALDGQMP